MLSSRTRTEAHLRLAQDVNVRMEAMMRLLLRERAELSRSGMFVLAVLRDQGPTRITDLAGLSRVSQPAMTTMVSKLEADGLVERRADDRDRRVVNVAITDEGRALQVRVWAARSEALAARLERLDDEQLAALAEILPVFDRITEPAGDGRP